MSLGGLDLQEEKKFVQGMKSSHLIYFMASHKGIKHVYSLVTAKSTSFEEIQELTLQL